jgi:hypothetical protein
MRRLLRLRSLRQAARLRGQASCSLDAGPTPGVTFMKPSITRSRLSETTDCLASFAFQKWISAARNFLYLKFALNSIATLSMQACRHQIEARKYWVQADLYPN